MVMEAMLQGRASCLPSTLPTSRADWVKFSFRYSSPRMSFQSARTTACATVLKMPMSPVEAGVEPPVEAGAPPQPARRKQP